MKRSSAVGGLAFAALLGAVGYGLLQTTGSAPAPVPTSAVSGTAASSVNAPQTDSSAARRKPALAPRPSPAKQKSDAAPANRSAASAGVDAAAKPAAAVSAEIPVATPPVATVPVVTPPVATPPVATPVQAQPQTAQTIAAVNVSSAPVAAKIETITVKIEKDAVIGISLDQALNTETAHTDDRVSGRIARDVVVDGHTAIPAGAKLEGTVTLVQRGRNAERGKLGVRFTTLVLDDNTRIAIQTETVFRESDPVGEPAASISASTAVGALLANGGRRGVAPARPGTPPPTSGGYKPDVRVSSGSPLTVKLTAPLTITVIK